MSAAGLSASGTSSATVYIPGPSSRRKSSTVSAHIIPSNIRGEKQHKFYIPGETPSGGHFPTPKKVSSALCTTDPLHPGASVASAASGIRNQQSGASRDGILHYVYDKFLGVIQNTFKKGEALNKNPFLDTTASTSTSSSSWWLPWCLYTSALLFSCSTRDTSILLWSFVSIPIMCFFFT